MGSRRDSYLTNDPMGSDVKPPAPSLGDVLTKRPEPGRSKFIPPLPKPVNRRKGKTP